ncbi:serine/threonine protein kinase [Ectothiorhodospiraceae bacterium WFHF3C12]|nr:serine/threonine protein kinase [Ectothiorhodospiraceae bacterium WFHF3C12]
MAALRDAIEAYRAGRLDAATARRRLNAASAADGRPAEALLDALADSVVLTPAQRAELLPESDGGRTRVSDAGEAVGRSNDDATRVGRAEKGPGSSVPGSEDATRLRPEKEAGPVWPEGQAGQAGRDKGNESTGSEWTWSEPDRWRETTHTPIGPGTVLKERFVLEELVGHGGMGAVYRARDLRKEEAEDSDPYVALKLLNDEFREHPDALIALQREAKKAQTLAHPNVVTAYDFDRDGTTVYLSMEFLRGEPLDAVIRGRGVFGLPQKLALQIIDRMSRGLAYAHQEGFVHADFKPGNVFLNEAGNVKILDFGIARAAKLTLDDRGDGDRTRFDPATIGAITPAYASPEMLAGEAAQPADDVYALACVAYEVITGKHPFLDEQGRKVPGDEAARQGVRPAPLRRMPKRVNRAILRGLAFTREERFPDAGRFLEAIKGPAKVRRTAVAAIVLLAALAATSWWITYRESDVNVTLDDLPPALSDSRALIVQGDGRMEAGETAQAHKFYAQAWESAEEISGLSGRDRSRLRVVVDRRINSVIDRYLERSRDPQLDDYSLQLLRLSLESLSRHELGTRDREISEALERVNRRLEADDG